LSYRKKEKKQRRIERKKKGEKPNRMETNKEKEQGKNRERDKRSERERKRRIGSEKERNKPKKTGRKNRGWCLCTRKEKKRNSSSAAWNHRHQRAPSWASTAATAGQFPRLSLLPSSPSLLDLHCYAKWIVESELIHSPLFAFCFWGRKAPAQPKMIGSGPAQSKNKTFKKIFSKICDFPVYFYTEFRLILICIFIS